MRDKILIEIKKSKKIAILPHISADGDALGSAFALALGLKKMNKDIDIYLEEEIPKIYDFLPGRDFKKDYEGNEIFYDLVIAIDTGSVERLGHRKFIFNNCINTINIDHHKTNDYFGFNNWIDVNASSVGEMIYAILKALNIDMDKDIATCLYVAISTDTGSFRFSNTTSLTHKIISDIISYEIDVADISKRIFDNISIQKLKLMSKAINSVELYENGKIALMSVSDDKIGIDGLKNEDFDGIVNLGRNVNGVEVSILLRKWNDKEIKVNFRSNYYVDVSKVAGVFKGGGHKRAAGCIIKGSPEEIKKIVLKEIISEI
jgi:phosphoesterase RecJ-like protein